MDTKGLLLAQSGRGGAWSPMDRQRTRDMLPVANKPILFHALDSMAAAGITDVAIAVGADAEEPIAEAVGSGAPWGMHVTYTRTEGAGCVAAALLAAESFVDGHPFVVQHGDGLLRDDLGALLRSLEADGAEPSDAVLLVHGATGARRREGSAGLRAVENGRFATGRLAMAGAQIFGRGFLDHAAHHIHADQPVLDLASLATALARSSARVSLRRIDGWRRFDGDPNVLLDMNRVVLDDLDPGH